MIAGLAVATAGAYLIESDTDSNHSSNASKKEQLWRGETLGRRGGIYFDYRMATGVDCNGPVGRTVSGRPWYNTQAELDVSPGLDDDRDYVIYPGDSMVFAGENSQPSGSDGNVGYYPLRSGWAIRYRKEEGLYDFYHFDVRPHGSEPSLYGGRIPIGMAYGQRIGSYTLAQLEAGAAAEPHTDNRTTATLEAPQDLADPYPHIRLYVKCAQDISSGG